MGPMGTPIQPMLPHWEKLFSEKVPKNPKCQLWGENQSCSHRNSAHFGTHTVSWGPLNDHFPGCNNFVKIGQNGPIPQSAQIWPSGRASGLEPHPPRSSLVVGPPAFHPTLPARFDSTCVFQPRCDFVAARAFSAAKIDLFQKYIVGLRIFIIFYKLC